MNDLKPVSIEPWFTGNGLVMVECPECQCGQGLPQGRDGYTIHNNGDVYPMFVCVNVRCRFTGRLRLKGW